MPSDIPPEEQIPESSSVGRFRERLYSGLDRILANGKEILLYGGLIGSYLVCIFAGEEAISLIGEYWPIILGPILGWWFAQWSIERFYHPSGRYIALLDPENHTFRVLFVPDAVYRNFNQSGNNVVYHTASGYPLYVARDINPETMVIDYGWIHELNALEVMTREEAFAKWDQTLSDVLEENLELMSHPHIIGLGYARKSVRDNLDGLAEVMGFKDMDFGQHGVAHKKQKGTPADMVPEDYEEDLSGQPEEEGYR